MNKSSVFSSTMANSGRSIMEQPQYTFRGLLDEVNRMEKIESERKKKKRYFINNASVSKSQNFIPHFDPDSFNLDRKIREIRQMTREKDFDPLKKEARIAFARDKVDIVFESTKLLKEIQKRKNNTLAEDEVSLRMFLKENKEISIKNLLIKLLKNESDKLETKERSVNKALNDGQINFKNDQKSFNDFSEMQKKACKEIERVLFEIQKKNKELSDIEKSYKGEGKAIEEEMGKILEQIDNSRICAKFVNHVLGGDPSKYSKEVIIDIKDNSPNKTKINFENSVENVIQNYSFVLDKNMTDLKVLKDPNSMLLKFGEYEDSILRLMEYRDKYDAERERIEKENSSVIIELEKRLKMHLQELDMLEAETNSTKNSFKNLSHTKNYKDAELIALIKDIHKTIMGSEFYGRNKFKNLPTDYVVEGLTKIKQKETLVNDLIAQLEIYENDPKIFYSVINWRKNQNKENKQLLAKQKLEQIQALKKAKAEERFNRIVVQSRKTEAPFHHFKKTKKMVVNEDEIIKQQNQDLINY